MTDLDGLPPRPWADDALPDPAVLAGWLLSLTRPQLETVLARRQTAWAVGERCWIERHDDRLAEADGHAQHLLDRLAAAEHARTVVQPPDLTDVDEARLRDAFRQQTGRVMLLPNDDPGPVPFLHVPADDACDRPPPEHWRATLRATFPDAAGVSQCALTPGHDGLHIGLLWLPNSLAGRFDAHQVAFRDVE